MQLAKYSNSRSSSNVRTKQRYFASFTSNSVAAVGAIIWGGINFTFRNLETCNQENEIGSRFVARTYLPSLPVCLSFAIEQRKRRKRRRKKKKTWNDRTKRRWFKNMW